jgi:hypothetical protein
MKLTGTSSTYSGMSDFCSRIEAALKEINSISPKQLFLLSRYFKEDTVKVTESFKEMEERKDALKSFLENEGKVIMTEERARRNADRISSLLERSRELVEEEAGIKAEIAEAEKSEKEARKRLESMHSGAQWREMKRLEESGKKAAERMGSLESEANEILSDAKRPLKKLRHLMGTKEAFPENPFRDIILESREGRLRGLVGAAIEKSREGEMELKPREAEKLEGVLRALESEIPKMKSEYAELSGRMREIERQDSHSRARRMEDEMVKESRAISEKLKGKWAELDSNLRERKETDAKLSDLVERTERMMLREGGKRLEIKLPPRAKPGK